MDLLKRSSVVVVVCAVVAVSPVSAETFLEAGFDDKTVDQWSPGAN